MESQKGLDKMLEEANVSNLQEIPVEKLWDFLENPKQYVAVIEGLKTLRVGSGIEDSTICAYAILSQMGGVNLCGICAYDEKGEVVAGNAFLPKKGVVYEIKQNFEDRTSFECLLLEPEKVQKENPKLFQIQGENIKAYLAQKR